MQSRDSYDRQPSGSDATVYPREHVDPYSDASAALAQRRGTAPFYTSAAPGEAGRRRASVLAPSSLYTPSQQSSSARLTPSSSRETAHREADTAREDGARARRTDTRSVRIRVPSSNTSASGWEERAAYRSGQSTENPRHTAPPRQPPLARVIRPGSALMDVDGGPPSRAPRTRGPGSNFVPPTPSSTTASSSPRASAATGSVTVSPANGGASSVRSGSAAPPLHSRAPTLSAIAPPRPPSTGAGDTPIVDFFAEDDAGFRAPTQPPGDGPSTQSSTHYVAQTAYTQHNPFRAQTFADFAAHANYEPPEGFVKYPEAVTDSIGAAVVSGGEDAGRVMQGEFLIRRLADLAQPVSEANRNDMIEQLNSTLEMLQEGEWFYKWTRANSVHRRFVWLNIQRGTLAWSPSPKQSLVWNTELKLSEVLRVKPDAIRDAASGRTFYRMSVDTAGRGLCLATEVREKFDCWFRALQQLTLPNLQSGVPGMWGRPSSVVNDGRRGAVGRWASRYSPLQAIADGSNGVLGSVGPYTGTGVSSSD